MQISKYFNMREALFLPQWNRVASKKDGLTVEILNNLKALFSKLDLIREHFKKPIIVHVAYRPKQYNAQVNGAKNSAHLYGMACDFHIKGMNCDDVRYEIINSDLLNKLGLRMENLPLSGWIHCDIREPGPAGRFFKP